MNNTYYTLKIGNGWLMVMKMSVTMIKQLSTKVKRAVNMVKILIKFCELRKCCLFW